MADGPSPLGFLVVFLVAAVGGYTLMTGLAERRK